MSLFNFGSRTWPGLAKLAEECGEVLQVLGKLVMIQGRVEHWDGSNLKERIEEEIADVLAACAFFIETGGLDRDKIAIRRHEKEALFWKWHQAQEDNGAQFDEQEVTALRTMLKYVFGNDSVEVVFRDVDHGITDEAAFHAFCKKLGML